MVRARARALIATCSSVALVALGAVLAPRAAPARAAAARPAAAPPAMALPPAAAPPLAAAAHPAAAPRVLPPPQVRPPAVGGRSNNGEDPISEARRVLSAGELDVTALAVHAKTLLDAGEIGELATALEGDRENAMLGILEVLRVTHSQELLVECVDLAAGAPFERVTALARDHLARLAEDSPSVVATLVDWLDDAGTTDGVRHVLVECLGTSRNLAAVGALVEQLEGPSAPAAREALRRLTGHDPPAADPERPPAAAWRSFWATHGHLSRDQLVELAREADARRHAAEVERYAVLLRTMEVQLVDALLRDMGTDVDKLVGGLSSPYADVRRTAAERLANHDNKSQAKSAVPVILRALGHGEAGGAAAEPDPRVRVAMVAALGVLGRTEEGVRAALLAELRSGSPQVGAAAVEALRRVRNDPLVIGPLLDYLERLGDGEATTDQAVLVLKAVAENQPRGIIPRLQRWLASRNARVRAGAARALLASEDVLEALDELSRFDLVGEDEVVRFDVAVALGNRLRSLEPGSPARPRIIELLSGLLGDEIASVRAEAASSLGESGDTEALALLDERSRQEPDAGVRARIVGALGELGFPAGVRIVGRICSATGAAAPEVAVLDAGRGAITAIGADGGADVWFDMAGRLVDVSALALAAWTYQEVERRFSAAPEFADIVNQSRGRRAEVLWQMGQLADARKLLLELQTAEAPYPAPARRLELLARTSEQLGENDEAARHFLELLEIVPVGAAGWAELRRDAARTLRKAARHNEALAILTALRNESPDDNVLMHELALVQEGLGQHAQALDLLQRLAARLPAEDQVFAETVRADIARVESVISSGPAPATAPALQPGAAPAGAATGGAAPAAGTSSGESAPPGGSR